MFLRCVEKGFIGGYPERRGRMVPQGQIEQYFRNLDNG